MASEIQSGSPYSVKWDQLPPRFKSGEPTTGQKVWRVVYLILSVLIPVIGLVRIANYFIDRGISKILLPAQLISKNQLQAMKQGFQNFWNPPESGGLFEAQLRRCIDPFHMDPSSGFVAHRQQETDRMIGEIQKRFKPEYTTITTPDGAEISVTLLRYQGNDEEDCLSPLPKTLLHFNGNGEYSLGTGDMWPLVESIKMNQPLNYVLFDYRNVGDSKWNGGSVKPNDLILDGTCVAKWAEETLGVTPIFYGKSLGGGVAAGTQALRPDWNAGHLNQNSFSSIEAVVRSILGYGCLGNLAVRTLQNKGYVLNAADAFREIQGPKFVVRHPQDRVITTAASLQESVQHDHFMTLTPHHGFAQDSIDAHHNAPLEWHKDATAAMAQFVFGEPVAQTQVI